MRESFVSKTLLACLFFFLIACNSMRHADDYTRNYASKSKKFNSSSRKEERNKYTSSKYLWSEKKAFGQKNKKNKNSVARNAPQTHMKGKLPSISVVRKNIVKEAENYIGVPYKYGGSSPRAFDCSGFTQYCLRSEDIHIARSSKQQSMQGHKIALKDAQPGDLIFFGERNTVSHVGIISRNGGTSLQVIHASSSYGVIEEDVLSSVYWRSRILFVKNVLPENAYELGLVTKRK